MIRFVIQLIFRKSHGSKKRGGHGGVSWARRVKNNAGAAYIFSCPPQTWGLMGRKNIFKMPSYGDMWSYGTQIDRKTTSMIGLPNFSSTGPSGKPKNVWSFFFVNPFFVRKATRTHAVLSKGGTRRGEERWRA